ncbi:GLPGLI family protein [Flagellimonas lutaonensis]|uniref:GLPGLI family protein n=1 Tax=Flagellimonas lutaonensis TaxID=516051 RepID=A0A0D5YUB5_9FLAO|nr:GLPGLI family protein [Allomuricauda lutaonensis]AKA35476.1 hypothetical protein VC82_1871 [Allomuricauda lutaonensis]
MFRTFCSFAIFLFITTYTTLTAQSSSNKLSVVYKKSINASIDTANIGKYKSSISNFNRLLKDNAEEVSYKLTINGHHSIFIPAKSLASDYESNNFRELSTSFGGTKGSFYINRRDSIYFTKKHFSGQDFRVTLKPKKWEISKETKLICGFKCQKATSVDKIKNSKGEFVFDITAWFCTDLPSFFGPAGYFGLPGLILELDNGKIKLTATKIMFDDSGDIMVKPFKKGIMLSEQEYDSIVEKTAESFFKRQ